MPKSETQLPPQEQADPDLSPSLWAKYKYALHGLNAIERSYGFITYRIDGEVLHIADLFIDPQYRDGSARRELFEEVTKIAKSQGATTAVGQVQISANGATRRIRFWLMMGAEVYQANGNVIYFVKRL